MASLGTYAGVPRKFVSRALAGAHRYGLMTVRYDKPERMVLTGQIPVHGKKRGAPPPKRPRLSDRTRRLVFRLDDGRCAQCARAVAFRKSQTDHIIPLAYGGRQT